MNDPGRSAGQRTRTLAHRLAYFQAGFPKLEAASGGAGPAAALVDPLGGYLYVIYLPDVERPGTSVVLHYSAKPTAAARP